MYSSEEYTCNICIGCSDFERVGDFSAVQNCFSVLTASVARIVLRLCPFQFQTDCHAFAVLPILVRLSDYFIFLRRV